jgi:hypothetical protein
VLFMSPTTWPRTGLASRRRISATQMRWTRLARLSAAKRRTWPAMLTEKAEDIQSTIDALSS